MAEEYDRFSAYCGYAAVIECTDGSKLVADFLKAGSQQYQGKCLSEEQAGKAFVKFMFLPNGPYRYQSKNWCGKSEDSFEGKIRFIKIFETTKFGSGVVQASNFVDTMYLSGDPQYANAATRRWEVEGSLLKLADLRADNPKIVRASTKNSGGQSGQNPAQIKNTADGTIQGVWKNGKPTGSMLVSYRGGGVYLGEYAVRPDRQRPGAVISSRTGQGTLISSDGTKKRGLWFDDAYAGVRTSSDKLPALKDLQKVLGKVMPTNDDVGSGCDTVQSFYSACKYAPVSDHTMRDFAASLIANHLDVNVRYNDYEDHVERVKAPISSILAYLVQSGRFSVYSKISESDEALGLLKVVLGRYKPFTGDIDGEGNGCGDDSCFDDENFEIHMVDVAASQCSELVVDYLEMKGISLFSEIPDIDPAKSAKDKAEEFPSDSAEYRTCMRLAQRLTKK